MNALKNTLNTSATGGPGMASPATASALSPTLPFPKKMDRQKMDRRMSAEWDAALVPPSRFQKPKGSIYAVPGSRDGHVDHNYPAKFHELCHERGYDRMK